MGLHIFWDDEQKLILRQVYDLSWTWDEYLAAFAKIRELASEVDYPIGMISEIGMIKSVPPNAILYGARGIRSLPSNIVLTVMVTESQLALSLLNIILTATQFKNIETAKTAETANRMIMDKLNMQVRESVSNSA